MGFLRHLLKRLYYLAEDALDIFFTYHVRPRKPTVAKGFQQTSASKADAIASRVCILVQGPINLEYDFTIETLRLYRGMFPDTPLVLSTWVFDNKKFVDEATALGVSLVLSQQPKNRGPANINLQIVSTTRGLEKARELNCDYVLKTRSDQRIYNIKAIDVCLSALRTFPLKQALNQRARLISFSMNTFLYRPYGVSDMINFGHVDDMAMYWCVPLDDRKPEEIDHYCTLMEFAKLRLAEVYFVTQFLENTGSPPKWTLTDSWRAMSEQFCILSSSDLDIFWPKYTRKEFRHRSYEQLHNRELGFFEWLIFHHDFPKEVPEEIVNTKLENLDSFNGVQ